MLLSLPPLQAGIAYQSRGNVALDMDVVKLLKSQDANYVRTQLAIERSQAERTKAQLQQLTDLLPEASSSSSARSPAVPIEEDSDDEDAALERNLRKAEAETLAASGLLGPAAKGKGKAAAGRPARKPKKTVFVDSRAERACSPTPLAVCSVIARRKKADPDCLLLARCAPARLAVDAYQPSASTSSNAVASSSTSAAPADAPPVDLGWASPPKSKKARKADAAAALAASSSSSAAPTAAALAAEAEADRVRKSKKHRLHLLHSLSSHLTRAAHLAEAQKEMELQKLLMGKGGKKKLASLKPEEESDPEEEFDEDNPQKRRREGFSGRAFKWAAERKR